MCQGNLPDPGLLFITDQGDFVTVAGAYQPYAPGAPDLGHLTGTLAYEGPSFTAGTFYFSFGTDGLVPTFTVSDATYAVPEPSFLGLATAASAGLLRGAVLPAIAAISPSHSGLRLQTTPTLRHRSNSLACASAFSLPPQRNPFTRSYPPCESRRRADGRHAAICPARGGPKAEAWAWDAPKPCFLGAPISQAYPPIGL